MGVVRIDSNGKLKKQKYFKDGYPQKVFKDGKLIFPDFCMVNSGGHPTSGAPNCKTSRLSGDMGFNDLFTPYSSTEHFLGNPGWFTEYHTDTTVYGDNCYMSDSFNLDSKIFLNIPSFAYKEHPLSYPLSSVSDCIVMDGDTYRDYLNNLNYSSSIFLYAKISADTDSIESFVEECDKQGININVHKELSFNPMVKFGVHYNYIKTIENGEKILVGSDNYEGARGKNLKYFYLGSDTCSNKIDIECQLNVDDNIYCGYTNKYIASFEDEKSVNRDNKSQILNYNAFRLTNGLNPVVNNVFISPNYELITGYVHFTSSNIGSPATATGEKVLYVNSLCSGEFGVSFDKDTPRTLTLCNNLSADYYSYGSVDDYSIYMLNDSTHNSINITTSKDSGGYTVYKWEPNTEVYPFNNQFYLDFVNYCVENDDLRNSGYSGTYFPKFVVPDYCDYKDGKTDNVYGTPSFLDTRMVQVSSDGGFDYEAYNGLTFNLLANADFINATKYGAGLYMAGVINVKDNVLGKYIIKTEFDARTKFDTVSGHQLPICLYTNNYTTFNNFNIPKNDGELSMYKDHSELKNLCGDDWEVNNEWRHYCFTAEQEYQTLNLSSNSVKAHSVIPYFTLWGNELITSAQTRKKLYPYEVKNVTTKIYL